MSDTFGASDLNATDMPGLGPQPGNVRGPPVQLPSALQGLVHQFMGQPNQKFLSPQPNQQGQQKQPRLGSTDRPDPTSRAYAPLPANAPQPPAAFTPFIRSMPRDSSQWGEPEAYPRLPQSFELPGIFQQLGGYFAQSGSFRSGPLGAGMAAYAAAYQDAFVKGQETRMKMAAEQLKLHREQLADLEQEQLTRYADTYNMYAEKGGDLNTATIDGVTLHDAIWKDAVEIGDKNVITMLEDGQSVEKVRRYMMDHEARLRDLQKANAKATEEDTAAELYGLKPREAQGGADPWDRGPNAPAQPAASTAATPAPAPGLVAGPGAPGARAKDVGDQKPAEGEDADNIDDPDKKRMHDASVEVLKGFEPKDIPKDVLPYAGIAAREMNDTLGAIISEARAGKIRPDQIVPEVRKRVSGKVADDLQSLADYAMPGAGGGGQGGGQGGKEQNYLHTLGNLATVMKPPQPEKGIGGWNAANYQAQERFRTDVNTQTVILRSNSLAADGGAVLSDLKELERQGVNTSGLNMDGLLGLATRQPMYAKLYGDWLAYNDAFNSVVTGGRHVESGAQAQVNVAPVAYASPAAFRAAIKGHMTDALGYLEGEHRRWETIGGNPRYMPSQNLDTEKQLRKMRDMDYLTGTLPGETYTNKNGVTKRWKGGSLNPYDTSNWE